MSGKKVYDGDFPSGYDFAKKRGLQNVVLFLYCTLCIKKSACLVIFPVSPQMTLSCQG